MRHQEPQRTRMARSQGPLRVALLAAAFSLLLGLALSAQAQAADPTIAAVGDMACSPIDPTTTTATARRPAAARSTSRTWWSARCRRRLLDLGDNQYDNGELANYQAVYDPTFGRANASRLPEPRQRRVRARPTPRASSTTSRAPGSPPGSSHAGGDASHLLERRLLQLRHRRLAPDRAQLELRPRSAAAAPAARRRRG